MSALWLSYWYVYIILTYFGKNPSYNEGVGKICGVAEKIFDTLLSNIDQGHHLFADHYYITYKLIEYLTDKNMHHTNTLNANRKDFARPNWNFLAQPA